MVKQKCARIFFLRDIWVGLMIQAIAFAWYEVLLVLVV